MSASLLVFIALVVVALFFFSKRKLFARVPRGFFYLNCGLWVLSAAALLEAVTLGHDAFFPAAIGPDRGETLLGYFGYLPGLVLVLLGLSYWLPALERLDDEVVARRNAELLLKDALESIDDAFVIFDKADRIVMFNSTYKAMFKSIADLIRPGAAFEDIIRAQVNRGQIDAALGREEEWIADRIRQHRNPSEPVEQVFEDGRIFRLSEHRTSAEGIVAIRSEITALRDREKALAESRAQLAEAQALAKLGSWGHDFNDEFYAWSDETTRILGYDIGAIEPGFDTYIERVHPEDLSRMQQTVAEAVAEKGKYTIQYRICQPGGTQLFVEERGHVHVDDAGEPKYLLGTIQDITEKHLADLALHDALRSAEEATRAKAEFLANMSHELRSPLNAIIGFSDIMKEEMFGPVGLDRYKAYVEDISSSGKYLLALINDVLDMSSVEYGSQEIVTAPVAIIDVLDSARTILSARYRAKNVGLIIEDQNMKALISVDERRMQQVFINLLGNAMKFTPENGRVTVSARICDDGSLQISVMDTGFGIDPDEIETALSPFGRGRKAAKKSIEGTGLGLPLSKAIVEAHGGALAIESDGRSGTTVIVTLPGDVFVIAKEASSS
jgi:two-component system cell cycle sensor histidine kinase PleC